MIQFKKEIEIAGRKIGDKHPAYFIADIAANHDGEIERAKDLIFMAAEAGADAAKFQHFAAETIVSDKGFEFLGAKLSHQANWQKSTFEVYKEASLDLGWTQALKNTCDAAGITFFTSPYSLELVEHIDQYVPAYKIGSGDIDWIEIIEHIAAKQKPYMLASGASRLGEVQRAVEVGGSINSSLVLMQCNTNYTASLENFKYINLNVLKTFRSMFPNLILGLSDHTPGHSTVLGAITLGARVVEKHFTDDTGREGPDHKFSMDPVSWKVMVENARELEAALGSGNKKVEDNEKATIVVQRRSIRAAKNIKAGAVLGRSDLEVLRPCPPESLSPSELNQVVGRGVRNEIECGACITWIDLE